MIITYLKSKSQDEIIALRAFLRNVTDPVQGREAVDQYEDEDGNIIPAQLAIGDPEYYYASVLASFPLAPFGTLEAADKETCIALVGTWGGHDG